MGYEFKEKEQTEKLIGGAMKVHRVMGNGFQEVIYQRCFEIELQRNNIPYSREHEMPLFYENELVGTRRVDFLIDGKISVELKAIADLEESLQFKRLLNRKYKSDKSVNPTNPSSDNNPTNPLIQKIQVQTITI